MMSLASTTERKGNAYRSNELPPKSLLKQGDCLRELIRLEKSCQISRYLPLRLTRNQTKQVAYLLSCCESAIVRVGMVIVSRKVRL